MKSNSLALITATVGKRGPISRIELARLIGLSRSHTGQMVDELIAEGALIESEAAPTGRGRPRMLCINADAAAVAGVWFSERDVKVAIAGLDGVIVSRGSLSYESAKEDGRQMVDMLADEIRSCLTRAGKTPASLRGVGVTAAGRVDPLIGILVEVFKRPWLNELPIAGLLGEALGVPVYADTDIRASALADQWERDEAASALYISFCAGVGAALVNGQRLFDTAHGCSPLVGHAVIDRHGPMCNSCHKRGCLEHYTSSGAFIRRIWPDIDTGRLSAEETDELLARSVRMISESDPLAIHALSETAKYMGLGISNAIVMLGPQSVYIGGDILDAAGEIDGLADSILDLVRRETIKLVYSVLQGVQIKATPMLSEFEMRGALVLVLLSPYRRLQEINSKVFSLGVPKQSNRDAVRTAGSPG